MSVASIKSNDVRLNDNCVICTSTLKGGANEVQNDRDLMLVERCKHVFHRTCLQQHMQTPSDYTSGVKTCPVCRGDLSNVSVLHPNSSGDFETTGESVAAPFLVQDDLVLIDHSLFEADIGWPLHLNVQQHLNHSLFQQNIPMLEEAPMEFEIPLDHQPPFSGSQLQAVRNVFAAQILGNVLNHQPLFLPVDPYELDQPVLFQLSVGPFEIEQNPFLNPVQDVSDFNFEIGVDNSEISEIPSLADLSAFLQNMRGSQWSRANEHIVVPPLGEISEQAEGIVFSFFEGLGRLFNFVWTIISVPF